AVFVHRAARGANPANRIGRERADALAAVSGRPLGRREVTRLAFSFALAGALLLSVRAQGANPPGALDLPPSNVVPAPVDMAPAAPTPAGRPIDPTGNPLWAIPLSALTATRERPLFLPSRRAPAPAVAGTPVVTTPPPPPPP